MNIEDLTEDMKDWSVAQLIEFYKDIKKSRTSTAQTKIREVKKKTEDKSLIASLDKLDPDIKAALIAKLQRETTDAGSTDDSEE